MNNFSVDTNIGHSETYYYNVKHKKNKVCEILTRSLLNDN